MKEYKTNITKAIRKQLEGSVELCLEALDIIRNYQVAQEYFDGNVRYLNYQGFTPHDSKILTEYCISNHKYGSFSAKQKEVIHTLMPKYARQLRDHFIKLGKICPSNDSRYFFNPATLWTDFVVPCRDTAQLELELEAQEREERLVCGPVHDETWYETMGDDRNYFNLEAYYADIME